MVPIPNIPGSRIVSGTTMITFRKIEKKIAFLDLPRPTKIDCPENWSDIIKNPKKYKRIAGIETDEEAEEMLEELIDRFGEPPKSVQNLLTIARLKAVAHSVYIKEIVQREDLLKILMYEKAKIHAQHIPELVKAFAPSLKFAADPKGPYFTYRLGANSREKNREILEVLRQLLEQMHVFLCAEP